MTATPVGPIFVIEGHDVAIFRSVEEAQNFLEPPDVSAGTYSAYDAQGRRLSIETDGYLTRIALAESAPSSREELEAELRRFLVAHGESWAADEAHDLARLVEAAKAYAHRPFFKEAWESLTKWLPRRRHG